MNLRDIKPHLLKRLAMEGENEFDQWMNRTNAVEFGTQKPLSPKDIWRTAYSKGAASILRRVDKLRDD